MRQFVRRTTCIRGVRIVSFEAMFPRFLQLLLVCLLALSAWSAANAHARMQDAFVGDGLAVMVDAGEERDAVEDPQDDGDAQSRRHTACRRYPLALPGMADAGAVFPLVACASRAGKSKTRPDSTAASSKRTDWLIPAVAAPGAFRAGFLPDLFVFAIRGVRRGLLFVA